MLLVISLIALVVLAYAARAGTRDGLIARHTFNNHYSDAAAAREDHLG